MYVSMRKTAEKGRFLRLIVANRIVRAASKLLLKNFSTFSHLIKCLLQSRFSGCGLPLSGFDALLFTFPILNLHSIRVFSYGFDLVRQLGAGGGGGAGAGGDGVLVLVVLVLLLVLLLLLLVLLLPLLVLVPLVLLVLVLLALALALLVVLSAFCASLVTPDAF